VQTDTAKQPKIVVNGNLLKDSNNKPEIYFDGVDDALVRSTAISNHPVSLFSVTKFVDATTTEGSPISLVGGFDKYVAIQNNTSSIYSFASRSGTNVTINTGTGDSIDAALNSGFNKSGNSRDAYRDGEFKGSDTTALVDWTSSDIYLGARRKSSGNPNLFSEILLSEAILYNSDQSTKRRAIEENIANHYDISLAAFSRDGTVSTWYDQSGSTPANNATQTDPTKQPKIVEGGSLLKDSRNNPAIDFDDVDDNMILTSDLATGGAYSCVAYHEFNAPSTILKGNFNSPRIIAYQATSYQVGSYAPEVVKTFGVASSQGLVSVLKDASHNARVYVNGTESSSGQQNVGSGSFPFTMLSTGASGGAANGKLVEVIYYNSDQSDNRTAIEANIGETYGITGIPAANDTVNGFVQTWYDQSGSVPANDAEQISATKQPIIVSEGQLVTNTSGNAAMEMYRRNIDGVQNNRYLSMSSGHTAHSPFILVYPEHKLHL
jgi:hypothetical protein